MRTKEGKKWFKLQHLKEIKDQAYVDDEAGFQKHKDAIAAVQTAKEELMDVKKGIIKWHQVELTQNVQKEREDILHVDEEEKEYEVVLPKHLEPGDSIGLTGKGGAATVHLKTQDEDVLLCFSPSRPNLPMLHSCAKKLG